ncbi:MAG: Secreted protein [Acidimicrobiales bacterium]|nr:Secreted protein [Acidimicrobiales bacterium]
MAGHAIIEGMRASDRVRAAAVKAASGVLAGAAVLIAEVVWVTRRRLPSLTGLDASGLVAGSGEGPPVRLIVLGDSTVTGPGLTRPDEIWLRRALVELELHHPVDVLSFAVGGSRVSDVRRGLDQALAIPADLAVVAVGSNDAIHATPTRQFARDLDDVVRRLLEHVPVVAVGNVGDLGNIARVPPPLKSVLRRRGRIICRQIEEVVARHSRAVLLDVTTSDAAFRDRSVFAPDLFHPSPVGHSHWARAAVPGLQATFQTLGTHQAGETGAPAPPPVPEPVPRTNGWDT